MANNGIDADRNDRISKDALELENILIALDQVQQTVEVMHATVARLKNRIHANLEGEASMSAPHAVTRAASSLPGDGHTSAKAKTYRKRVTH